MRRAIERKRDGEALEAGTWESIVASYMAGHVDDAQMAALAMACAWRGLELGEITALTHAMAISGETLKYDDGPDVVDKHSSGGVGDIVSLIAVPLVASCDVHVGKLSGRALGHTGGTIDKLEAIEGFEGALSLSAFARQVRRIGCAIATQTDTFVPADKQLYRLRDRTGAVPSTGLIASSILSKKIAGGAHAFVFDVKCGDGAFMRDTDAATELAQILVEVARAFGRRAQALVTDMSEPLGRSIGTGIEVIEACIVLRGETADPRARDLSLHVAAAMLELVGIADAQATARRALESGRGYEKFLEMVRAQGGDRRALESLKVHERSESVRATRAGYVTSIDGVALGHAARELTVHERNAGIRIRVRAGDYVSKGDELAVVYGARAEAARIESAIRIEDDPPGSRPLIYFGTAR
jgi:pyrimidine-nucleoside phosphorylase